MPDTAGGSTSAPDGEAAIPASPSPNIVHLACPCPGTPHEFDTVTLHPTITNAMGIAAESAIAQVVRPHEGETVTAALRSDLETGVEKGLGMIWLRYGIRAWTFTDEAGPVPITEPMDPTVLDQWLPWARGGRSTIEVCNTLYSEEFFHPFQKRNSTRAPTGQGASSTFPPKGSGHMPRRPSKRSSQRSSAGKRSEVRGR